MGKPRSLPHRPEAENAVLGGILLRGKDALLEVVELVTVDDFYQPRAQAVFRAMVILDDRGDAIDVISLEAQLRRTGELELAGGIEGLARLDRYATAHNVRQHAELIAEAARVRNLVVETRQIAEEGMLEVEDVDTWIDDAEARVLRVAEKRNSNPVRSTQELMLEVFEEITARQRQTSPVTGVPTAFYDLDDMTAGLQPQDFIIVAGRPSMGKTAFALNLASNACVTAQKFFGQLPLGVAPPPRYPILFFSLEMGAKQLIQRVIASEARVPLSHLRRGGKMNESDFRRLISAADRVSRAQFYIDDTVAPTITEMRARARRWRQNRTIFPEDGHQLGAVMIDYLQLARGGKAKYDSREQEIADISRGCKSMARELKVPVIALSQLNRAVDHRASHRPVLADLRESGAIEQDADVIMFVYREERYLTEDDPPTAWDDARGRAEIIVAKQRNGPIGTVHLTWDEQTQTFHNRASEDLAA